MDERNKKPELSEAAKEARRQYLQQWRKKNPEKMRAYRVTYWERRARELTAAKEE